VIDECVRIVKLEMNICVLTTRLIRESGKIDIKRIRKDSLGEPKNFLNKGKMKHISYWEISVLSVDSLIEELYR